MEQTSNDNVFECSTFIDIEIAHYKNRGKSIGLIQTCSGITHGRVPGIKLVSHACSENGGKGCVCVCVCVCMCVCVSGGGGGGGGKNFTCSKDFDL